jgi:xanthine dehydrogenase accessory factor
MRDVLPELLTRLRAGEELGLATVTRTWHSSPRPAGSAMIVTADGEVRGSVSGGCVEGTVYELARDATAPAAYTFGVSDEDAYAVGLACGGSVEILVERVTPADLPRFEALATAQRPELLIFGASDFAVALSGLGGLLGYHVVVVDARPVFLTAARFPAADEIVVDWPHRWLEGHLTDERTVVAVLTHDAKFDVPLLEVALRRPLAYVGMLGSRRTDADRRDRLREAGVTEAEMAALRSPIGLDLGALTPQEVAVAIAAEIVASTRGGSMRPLRDLDGPLHRR